MTVVWYVWYVFPSSSCDSFFASHGSLRLLTDCVVFVIGFSRPLFAQAKGAFSPKKSHQPCRGHSRLLLALITNQYFSLPAFVSHLLAMPFSFNFPNNEHNGSRSAAFSFGTFGAPDSNLFGSTPASGGGFGSGAAPGGFFGSTQVPSFGSVGVPAAVGASISFGSTPSPATATGGFTFAAPPAGNEHYLNSGFSKLLENTNFADITLVVESEEIKAHKAILAGRSSYFAALLASLTGDRIEIENIPIQAFRTVLDYIYKGAIDEEIEGPDYLVHADAFDLPGMKEILTVRITRSMRLDNVINILKASLENHADVLAGVALDFILNNWQFTKNLVKSNQDARVSHAILNHIVSFGSVARLPRSVLEQSNFS